MANLIVKKQLDFIVSNANLTDKYEIDRVRYGLEVFFNESIKLITMFFIALLLHKTSIFILITALLLSIRPFIGGSHSKTLISCLLKSNFVYILIYILASIMPKINIFIHLLLILLGIIVVFIFKPVNSLRKKINLHYKGLKFQYIVSFVLITWFVTSNIFLSNYLINSGLLMIIYILVDFLKEVYNHEKKLQI